MAIKYEPDGHQLWYQLYSYGEANKAEAWGVTLDAAENVCVWGGFGTVKYDPRGAQLWAESISLGQVPVRQSFPPTTAAGHGGPASRHADAAPLGPTNGWPEGATGPTATNHHVVEISALGLAYLLMARRR